jgi:hypothetical protein
VIDARPVRRLLLGLLTLGLWAGALGPLRAQSRVVTEPPNDAKPVIISSDEAIAWNDGNLQILIVKGNVHLEQGLLRAQMKQAVLWMAGTEAEKGKSLPITMYGDGDVALDRAGVKSQTSQTLFELRTQEAFRLKSMRPVSAVAAEDPFYRRAVAERDKLLATPVVPANARPEPAQAQLTSLPAEASAPKVRSIQAIPTPTPDRRPEPPAGGFGLGGLTRRPKLVRITPRNTTRFNADIKPAGPDEQVILITGGVQVYVDDLEQLGIVDMSMDRAVIWVRNVDAQGFLSGAASGEATDAQIEVYLEGHVEIRRETTRGPNAGASQVLKADQAYYDVTRNVAQLINAEIIATQPGLPNEVHLRAEEIRQTAHNRFEASQAAVYSSRLPSDPDVFVMAQTATLEIREVPVRGLLGGPARNEAGEPLNTTQLYGIADDITLNVVDVPILYWPTVEGDLRDPLGPLEQVRFKQDRIFGTGVLVDWDLYKLLGLESPPGSRARIETDYLSKRGPALGAEAETAGSDLFGLPGKYQTLLKAYGIYDDAKEDILGPFRDSPVPKDLRGRVLLRHRQEIAPDFTFLGQFNYLSDRNFLEQYYKREFDDDFIQDTFAYLKKQQDFWAVSAQTQMNIRSWVTITEWLPLVDGTIIGYSPFDRLTYFARASAGYANQQTTSDLTPAYLATPFPDEFERARPLPPSSDLPHYTSIDLGRFDLWQELDLPLDAGPFKVVPYGILDLTYYTNTLVDDQAARVYGGGGVRASIPFTRVYPDVCSQLYNLNGIAHKIVLTGEYRYVESNVDFRELPLLDRLDDDATDQARRDLRLHRLATATPGSVEFNLATSPLYDPQLYALRRALETSLENLDDLQVLRLGMRQRWQTKRGFPGHEHILDWMTLDLRGTWFPDADRDNFGHDFAFLEYDYTWNIGDRTTLTSSGWLDPFPDGARVWNVGLILERPERALFYLGYRHIEPVDSQAVLFNATYIFSPKWAATVGSIYDFGQKESLGNTLVLTRIGTDLQIGFGIHYDALTNNFGVTFEILPALAPGRIRGLSGPAFASTGLR